MPAWRFRAGIVQVPLSRAQHVEKSWNARECQGLSASNVHILNGKWRGSHAECIQQGAISRIPRKLIVWDTRLEI
jgi:hypothetical protein